VIRGRTNAYLLNTSAIYKVHGSWRSLSAPTLTNRYSD